MYVPVYKEAISEIENYGKRLDSSLKGERYLLCRQRRLLHVFGATVLRASSAPVVAAARLAVYKEDGGPTIVKLPRVGKNGEIIDQLKIRTMEKGSENEVKFLEKKDPEDPRITDVGKKLRRYSIDELTQLKNVLKGEMSLINTRPVNEEEFRHYSSPGVGGDAFANGYILDAPGLTGPDQIMGRGTLTPYERAQLALEYFEEASFKRDIDILRKTVSVVWSQEGAH
jgi:lipopolysaccharide/colanic/teichoic acid biosynthesis glycosyltransferase